jgi:drug/metabolite transporter (DMT)-like permease
MPLTPPPAAARFSPRTVGLIAAVVTVLIWTSFIVIARASADPARGALLGPFDIAYLRIWGASLVLLPWGWYLSRQGAQGARIGFKGHARSSVWGLSPLPWATTWRIGVFGGLLYAMVTYSGFVFAPAAHASVLMPGSLPLWTALLAMVFLHDRITPARALGLALIVGGDLLVGGSSLLHAFSGGEVWKGDVLFVLAAMVWSVYSVQVRRYALDAVRATTAITAFAFVTYVPVYTVLMVLEVVPGRLLAAPLGLLVFHMLFQGVGSVAVSGIGFTKMIQTFGPVRSTMLTAVVPGLSALAAAVLLGEGLPWNVLVGLGLVTVGIVFGVRQSAPRADAINLEAARAVSTSARG